MPKVVRARSNRAAIKKKNSIILSTETVSMKILRKYYKNPRKGNVEKTAESLKENGQFKPLVVNIGTKTGRRNEILAGNHTYMGAEKLGWDEIEVAWVDVTEGHARRIVTADNGASDDSTYDEQILAELLLAQKEETGTLLGTTYMDDALDRLVKPADENADVDKIEDATDQSEGVFDLNDFVVFPIENDLGIPTLLPEMIPDAPPEKLDVWAGHELDLPRQEADEDIWWMTMWHSGCRGVNWHQAIPFFYTEDFHFEPVFTSPGQNTKKILNLGITKAVMPNYSFNTDWPKATKIWAAYRSHFVARFWQEAGLQVIPDIQYGLSDEDLALGIMGIPDAPGVVSVQVQNARGDQQYIRRTARLIKAAEDKLSFDHIIVYGHTDADKVLDRANLDAEVTRVAARTARRREYLNSGATINSQKVKTKKRKIKVNA